jgi:hypothetical protein
MADLTQPPDPLALAWEGPEEHTRFRLAQLIIAFSIAEKQGVLMRTIDRIAIYDFFTSNPFAMLDMTDDRDSADALRLELVGFAAGQLSYASVGQRFASRRERIRNDIAVLVSRGLVQVGPEAFEITPLGLETADQLDTAYADAYRIALDIILRRLSRMSDAKLNEAVAIWSGRHWLLLDLLDDVTEPQVQIKETRT